MTTPLTPAEITAMQQELITVKQQLANEVLKGKAVEYYAAAINAWFNTSLEFDKSMFALSGGGIALLVSLLQQVKTLPLLLLFIAAIVCFIVTTGLLLAVFQKNKPYAMRLAHDEHADSSLLDALDVTAKIFFGLAIMLTVILGVVIAVGNLS